MKDDVKVEELKKVPISDGDILVLETEANLSMDQISNIKKMLEERLKRLQIKPGDIWILPGFKVKVIKKSEYVALGSKDSE